MKLTDRVSPLIDLEVHEHTTPGISTYIDVQWVTEIRAFAFHRIRRRRAGLHMMIAFFALRVYVGWE